MLVGSTAHLTWFPAEAVGSFSGGRLIRNGNGKYAKTKGQTLEARRYSAMIVKVQVENSAMLVCP